MPCIQVGNKSFPPVQWTSDVGFLIPQVQVRLRLVCHIMYKNCPANAYWLYHREAWRHGVIPAGEQYR